MRIRRVLAPVAAGAVLTAFTAAVTACGSSGGVSAQASSVIDVSATQCGGTWSVSGPGTHTIQISNQGTEGGEVDLVNPANGAIYAEIENTGPGKLYTLTVMTPNEGFAELIRGGEPVELDDEDRGVLGATLRAPQWTRS